MKKIVTMLLTAAMILAVCSGCSWGKTEETVPSTQQTQPSTEQTEPSVPSTDATENTAQSQSGEILAAIWDAYGEEERFAAYGGAVENSVSDAPGDLDLANAEELTTRYLVPEAQLAMIQDAASLVHMMNNNIFTGVVFHLTGESNVSAFAEAVHTNVGQTQWICGQPDRLLMVQPQPGFVLMAFGSEDAMSVFYTKLLQVFPNSEILTDEAITA